MAYDKRYIEFIDLLRNLLINQDKELNSNQTIVLENPINQDTVRMEKLPTNIQSLRLTRPTIIPNTHILPSFP